MNSPKKINTAEKLISDITLLIEESRNTVAATVNTTLVVLYWKIGNRINADILKHKRAEYGKQIIASLIQRLREKYGKGWDEKTLRHCLRAAETFTEEMILSTVRRQLGWTHVKTIMYFKDELQRQFYMEMCILERSSTRKLRERNFGETIGKLWKE